MRILDPVTPDTTRDGNRKTSAASGSGIMDGDIGNASAPCSDGMVGNGDYGA